MLALGIGAFTGDSEPAPQKTSDPQTALDFSAPPRADIDAAPCAKVLAQLPVSLVGLSPRTVHTKPDTPFIVAWGDPAVVLRCGVDRPKSLTTGSGTEFFAAGRLDGPFYDVTDGPDDTKVFTTVDREAYVSVTVPREYSAKQLPTLSSAIAKALPPVCSTENTAPLEKLCTRRK